MKGYNFIINIITYWCFRSNVTRIVERQKSKEFPTSPIFLPSKWHIFQLTEQQNVARSKKNTDLNKVDKLKENKENTSSNLCDYFISRNQYLFEDAIKRVEKGINKSFRQIQSILFVPPLPRRNSSSLIHCHYSTKLHISQHQHRSRNDFQRPIEWSPCNFILSIRSISC